MQHSIKQIYQRGSQGFYLDQVQAVPCPDGKTRTVTIAGHIPALNLYRGWVRLKGKRVYGYVEDATTLNASFTLDDLHPNAFLMKMSCEQKQAYQTPHIAFFHNRPCPEQVQTVLEGLGFTLQATASTPLIGTEYLYLHTATGFKISCLLGPQGGEYEKGLLLFAPAFPVDLAFMHRIMKTLWTHWLLIWREDSQADE